MEKVNIGKIVNAVGLKGEVKVLNYSAYKERYRELAGIYIEDTGYAIEKTRFVKENVILKLSGVDGRDEAEALKGKDVYISGDELPGLPEGAYYIRDIIGFSVTDDNGTVIGSLSDVLQNRAQDLYEVELENGKKILIPAVEEFVIDIDAVKRQITVKLIEGFI